MRRGDSYCIPDESYAGTVVQSRMERDEDVDAAKTVLVIQTGKGIGPDKITQEFLLETRGSVPYNETTSPWGDRGHWHGTCTDITHR